MNTVVTAAELVGILATAVTSPGQLAQQVTRFLKTFRDARDLALSPSEMAILSDLALDLEYFVSSPVHRRQDTVYYGPSRALDEIRSALKALNDGAA